MKSGPKLKSLEEKFFSKIKKEDNGCWIYTGFTDKNGYGSFRYDPSHNVRAHRFSFWYHIYKPQGISWEDFDDFIKCVLHKCDNPPCCNPDHLFPGTNKDNTQDMIQKGRRFNNKGKSHGMCKLTEQEVQEIYNLKEPLKTISSKYGVTFQMVWRIKKHKAWTHITLNQA
jgi:hypothetical protein